MTALDKRAQARGSIRPWRGILYEGARICFLIFLRIFGWRVEGAMPPDRKLVVIAAPHTSNWDLMFMLGVAFYYRVPLRWMGKKSLVEGPFGWVMRWWGCLPVDRKSSNAVVEQVAAAYHELEEMALAVAPEGTRAEVSYWKTGFYAIAVEADVRIGFGYLDYHRKVGGIGGPFHPTGDFVADMDAMLQFYSETVTNFRPPIGVQPKAD